MAERLCRRYLTPNFRIVFPNIFVLQIMKKTLLISAAVVLLAAVVMGFEGEPKKRLIQVERTGNGFHTTVYLNPQQIVAFEQAQPNMDGINTRIFYGSPSRVEDKSVIFGVANTYDDIKQQMEECLQ
jgi:hypothetical protein